MNQSPVPFADFRAEEKKMPKYLSNIYCQRCLHNVTKYGYIYCERCLGPEFPAAWVEDRNGVVACSHCGAISQKGKTDSCPNCDSEMTLPDSYYDSAFVCKDGFASLADKIKED